MSQKCANCSAHCRGKHCITCYRQIKSLTQDNQQEVSDNMDFQLKDIISSQTVNLNEADFKSNENGALFANPSFLNGSFVDVEYVATSEDLKAVSAGEVVTEKFSLINLITSIVKKQTAPCPSSEADHRPWES